MKFFKSFSLLFLFCIRRRYPNFCSFTYSWEYLRYSFLFLAFEMHLVDPEKIGATGDFLLNNLAILFVPAGVGLLEYFDDIASIWPILLGAVVVCSIVTMVTAGKTAEGVEALLGYIRKKKASRVSVNEMEENQID